MSKDKKINYLGLRAAEAERDLAQMRAMAELNDAAAEEATRWERTAVSESEAKDVARKWSRMWKAKAKKAEAMVERYRETLQVVAALAEEKP